MATDNSEILNRLKFARTKREPKIKKPMPQKSVKKIDEENAEKEFRGENDTLIQNWFKARRKEMTGICQCGCAQKSSKKDDTYYRHSAAHIFPKRLFPSVMYHPLNFVERAFFMGCHTNMDEQGMDKWPNMADFDDIKEKFHVLAPLLTDEERGQKFYTQLEKIVYSN